MSTSVLLKEINKAAALNKAAREEMEKQEIVMFENIAKKDSEIAVENEILKQVFEKLNIKVVEYSKDESQNHFTYCCRYKNFVFTAVYIPYKCDPLSDALWVSKIFDIKSKKLIKYRADLLCNRKCNESADEFLYLMDVGEEEFINHKYGLIINLPGKLRDRGYTVAENNFKFDANGCLGNIEIDGLCLVKADMDFIHIFNKSKSGEAPIEASILSLRYQKLDEKNIFGAIDSSLRFIKGNFGFKEGDRYFGNKEIERIIRKYQQIIRRKRKAISIGDNGYCYAKSTGSFEQTNLLDGVELSKNISLYTSGIQNNQYCDFSFYYDKNIDVNNCILEVEYKVVNDDEDIKEMEEEYRGKFTELIKIVESIFKEFIKNN